MLKVRILVLVIPVVIILSCDSNQDCCLPITNGELIGKYRVYEYGYSPGDRYIIESIPADPPQLLNFGDNNIFSSNYQNLTSFRYYLILEDNSGEKILALFDAEPDNKNAIDVNTLSHSYLIKYEDFNVKLHYRYCIEGCHIGLNKIE